jgi:hypothetical protein
MRNIELIDIKNNYSKKMAEKQLGILNKQKLGLKKSHVFSMQSEIINNIVLESLAESISPRPIIEKFVVPTWAHTSFTSFISNIISDGQD